MGQINDDGRQFESICDCIGIATANHQSNLVSCVIYNNNLFVSDDANNCLHIFTLTRDRQSSYLCDDSITPFSPGSLVYREKILTFDTDPNINELYILTTTTVTDSHTTAEYLKKKYGNLIPTNKMPPKKGKDKEHVDKKPAKTDKQKKAEAEMMTKLTAQYNGVLSPDDLKGMKDIFDTYDAKNQGFIKTSLLGNILRTIGFNPVESDVQRAIKDVDPLKTDQLKFPDYVIAVISIPMTVTDKDIIPAFQMFDTEKRGLLEADEILKSLTNVGEKLDEIEANTFKENMNINELGLFDYNEFFLKFTQPPETKTKKKGKKKKKKK